MNKFWKLVITFTLMTAIAPMVNATEIILFQPGQSSWEWLLVPTSHDGGKRMREGKPCLFCHEGEEKVIGNLISSGEKLEPAPVSGVPGFIPMDVDATYDDEMLYLTLSWVSPVSYQSGDEQAPARVTVMLGAETLKLASIAGCWAACHNDMPGMPDEFSGEKLSKYLPGSRQKMARIGGGDNFKADDDLANQLANGMSLEYMQVALSTDGVRKVSEGYFLEARVEDADTDLEATAKRDGDRWTVEISRPLDGPGERLVLNEGREYTLAIALHENYAEGRYHLTAFPMRFTLGVSEAKLQARRR